MTNRLGSHLDQQTQILSACSESDGRSRSQKAFRPDRSDRSKVSIWRENERGWYNVTSLPPHFGMPPCRVPKWGTGTNYKKWDLLSLQCGAQEVLRLCILKWIDFGIWESDIHEKLVTCDVPGYGYWLLIGAVTRRFFRQKSLTYDMQRATYYTSKGIRSNWKKGKTSLAQHPQFCFLCGHPISSPQSLEAWLATVPRVLDMYCTNFV